MELVPDRWKIPCQEKEGQKGRKERKEEEVIVVFFGLVVVVKKHLKLQIHSR
jgi:hypothetical protein